MNPYRRFQVNLEAASDYERMYSELRSLKGLGQRGRLSAQNQYLMWLPRAMVVASLSALDAYVHDVLYQELPKLLDKSEGLSDELAEIVCGVVRVSKASHVRQVMPLIRSREGPRDLAKKIMDENLRYESYQQPERIVSAFKILGIDDVFRAVSERWTGPRTSRDDIAKRLAGYAKRRNQIAHESDLDAHHEPRRITPEYGRTCKGFIATLVQHMDGVVHS